MEVWKSDLKLNQYRKAAKVCDLFINNKEDPERRIFIERKEIGRTSCKVRGGQ